MNDETRGFVQELALASGALMRCSNCGDPHLRSDDEVLVDDTVLKVAALHAEGDLRLLGMLDVEVYVRTILRDSHTDCPMGTTGKLH